MADPLQITMAHFAASKDRRLETTGVGSCIVITLYDPEAKVGGLAHPMLPDDRFEDGMDMAYSKDRTLITGPAKTVSRAVEVLLDAIEQLGGRKERCIAKVAGGAHMFNLFDAPKGGIGQQNIEAVKKKFSEISIPIVAEDTGGTIGRIVDFDVQSGLMSVTTKI